ncbi:hypothetical protein [Hymenobacter sp. APR13]|uniref:hypothetical protein n=1 Tax=Hymenobacter sp. APR13 TaxID=1356852 RepID=UPI0004E06801|nr:hypothetical protein [Hymenobacter sp. APR13]AII54179.1 hypothetical protein N008_19600 [Hymenobacter sp. APR13]
MKKLLLAGAFLLCILTMAAIGPWFSGKIVYRNSFATLAGQDITDKLGPVLGYENLYYISGNNYKSYTDKKQLLQLYKGDTNLSTFFLNGKGTITNADKGGSDVVVKHLKETAVIAGYECQTLQVDSDGNSIVYYFSPKLRVDPEHYAKHQMGNWYTYLKASNGALPLKFVFAGRTEGYTMTCEATSVEAMSLAAGEFEESAPAR